MPAVFLSPIFNAVGQPTEGWLPLNQGKVYTYLAGTSTPHATYTTSVGNVQNDNPIILGVDGRPPNMIWLEEGISYDFHLADSDDNPIQDYEDITGIGGSGSACCPTVGDAESIDGQAFTMDVSLTEYTPGMVVYATFQDDQTVTSPTLNINDLGAINCVNGESGSILAYRILSGDVITFVLNDAGNAFMATNLPALETFTAAPVPDIAPLTTGTKFTYPGFPGGRIIGTPVGAVATASSSGSVSLDIKENGVSIFSTIITIDQDETSSITATTPPVVSDRVIANNATITCTCSGAGSGAYGGIWSFLFRRVTGVSD